MSQPVPNIRDSLVAATGLFTRLLYLLAGPTCIIFWRVVADASDVTRLNDCQPAAHFGGRRQSGRSPDIPNINLSLSSGELFRTC